MSRFVLLAIAWPMLAQTPGPLTEAFLERYRAVRLDLTESAELMPAEHYSFKLTPAQRAFGGWIAHTVMLNYFACAGISGKTAPEMDHSKHSDATPKEQLVAELRKSYEFCDSSFAGLTDERLLNTEVKAMGRTVRSVALTYTLIGTSSSHYGNMVGYLRSKGLVPPSTARSQKK